MSFVLPSNVEVMAGKGAWTPMNKESLTVKLLDLVEGRETPETWWSLFDEHETEL